MKGTKHDQFEVKYEAECMKHRVEYKPHKYKESKHFKDLRRKTMKREINSAKHFNLQTGSIPDNEAHHNEFDCYADIDFVVQTNTPDVKKMTKLEHEKLLDFIAEDSDIPVIFDEDNTGVNFLKGQHEVIEFNLETECISHNNPYYTKPESIESRHSLTKRDTYEKSLHEECCKHNVVYVKPTENETRHFQMKRRKNLWEEIKKAKSNVNIYLDDNDDFIPPPLALNDLSHFQSTIHNNKLVHEMMDRFSNGELNHSIHKCGICHEVRPVFYKTEPSSKFKLQNRKPLYVANKWEFNFSKRICKRCE